MVNIWSDGSVNYINEGKLSQSVCTSNPQFVYFKHLIILIFKNMFLKLKKQKQNGRFCQSQCQASL